QIPSQEEALALLRHYEIIVDDEQLQRTEKWMQDRCGKITGSRVKDAISKLKSGERSKAAKTLKGKIVAERLTCISADGDISNLRSVQHGIVTESLAVEAFEKSTGKNV
ncbi:MAG: YqaJ viral recombinase family protein, partial [Patescibacteria group bacterium]